MNSRLYLDHNATSPMRPAVRAAMQAALAGPHNASSVHAEGRAARQILDAARARVAGVIGASAPGVIFTASATEAINLGLRGMVDGPAKIRRLMISAIEHDAVRVTAEDIAARRDVALDIIPVTAQGQIDVDWLCHRLNAHVAGTDGNLLVAVMAANNETGVIQPIEAIAPAIFRSRSYLFVDAVQAFGKMPLDLGSLGADLAAISGHKVGGPVGAAALIVKPGLAIAPVVTGGGQELFRRAGTENLPAIVGLAALCAELGVAEFAALSGLRDAIEASLPAVARVWGQGAPRLANTLSFSVPGFSSETQVMALDLAGISVSAGAACSSGKVRRSSVLSAMGASADEATSNVRISLGWDTPMTAPATFARVYTAEIARWQKRHAA